MGFARRTASFAALVETTARAKAPGVTTARVTGLVLNGARMLTPELSYGALALLARLCEFVYDSDRWATGQVIVTPGNSRLAAIFATSERTVRRFLQELEDRQWIIRRYNQANRRSDLAGIDLRPVAARLEALRQADAALTESLRAERQERAEEVAQEVPPTRTDLSAREDESVHLNSLTRNPLRINPVQAAPQLDEQVREMVSLMLAASPTLQRALTPLELMELSEGASAPLALVPLVRAVSWLVRNRIGLQGTVWAEGLARHGAAALAAAVVAVERDDVVKRAGYLRGMLARSSLQGTVQHSLRAMVGRGRLS